MLISSKDHLFIFGSALGVSRDVESSVISLAVAVLIFPLLMVYFYFSKYRTNQRNTEIAKRNPTAISNQFLREFWEWFTYPIFWLMLVCNFSPNQVTSISLLLGIISGFVFTLGHISTGGLLLIISGTFDTLDGRLARHKRINSKMGAFFDSVVDRYCDYFILAGIIAYFSIFDPTVGTNQSNAYLGLLGLASLLGTHLISYSKERGTTLGVTDNRGIMQRADRMMILGTAAILDPLIYFGINLGFGGKLMNRYYGLGVGLFLISLFSNITAFRRIRRIMRALKKNEM